MRYLKLTVAYDGSAYAGWQIQPDRRTIQGEMQAALAQITGGPTTAVASGRTDAGVHALGQVVSVPTEHRLPCDAFQRALNFHLPRDIRVAAVEEAPQGFHAIRDAVSKRYRYLIHDNTVGDVFGRRYVWRIPWRLSTEAMHRASQVLLGTHDFTSFEASGAKRLTSVRTVFDIFVERRMVLDAERIVLEVEADGFLYNMVRNIVGVLVKVGRGRRPEDWPVEVLAAKNRAAAANTAPPQGLTLLEVKYGDENNECESLMSLHE